MMRPDPLAPMGLRWLNRSTVETDTARTLVRVDSSARSVSDLHHTNTVDSMARTYGRARVTWSYGPILGMDGQIWRVRHYMMGV